MQDISLAGSIDQIGVTDKNEWEAKLEAGPENTQAEEAPFQPLPRILAEDFDEFAEILAEDDNFPVTHDEWELLVEAQRAELAEEGHTLKLIDVRPAGFRQFLSESGGDASMNSLAGYVALLASSDRASGAL